MSTEPTPPDSIDTEFDYKSIQSKLSAQREPPWVMKKLINLFERYRQARKIGWSRPWNKKGTVIFQSYRLDALLDQELFRAAHDTILAHCESMPAEVQQFASELLADPQRLMGFIFLSEVKENGQRYERVTFGLGRVNRNFPRMRDRIDLDLDSAVENDQSLGLSRIRIFVDPYRKSEKGPLWQNESSLLSSSAQRLFQATALLSAKWAYSEKIWDHWTSNYLDYFGQRSWNLKSSQFPRPLPPAINHDSLPHANVG